MDDMQSLSIGYYLKGKYYREEKVAYDHDLGHFNI